jgi:hypothetical protein
MQTAKNQLNTLLQKQDREMGKMSAVGETGEYKIIKTQIKIII